MPPASVISNDAMPWAWGFLGPGVPRTGKLWLYFALVSLCWCCIASHAFSTDVFSGCGVWGANRLGLEVGGPNGGGGGARSARGTGPSATTCLNGEGGGGGGPRSARGTEPSATTGLTVEGCVGGGNLALGFGCRPQMFILWICFFPARCPSLDHVEHKQQYAYRPLCPG